MLPAFCMKLPLTVSVPIELPGATVPLTTVDGRMPVPARVASGSTNTPLELVRLPLATSVPRRTLVAPVKLVVPPIVSVPEPTFSRSREA